MPRGLTSMPINCANISAELHGMQRPTSVANKLCSLTDELDSQAAAPTALHCFHRLAAVQLHGRLCENVRN